MKALTNFIFGANHCLVERTFDLRWTGRYRFDFAKGDNEAVVQALPRSEKGGVIVFPGNVDGREGYRIISFAKSWLGSLSKKPKCADKGEMTISSGLTLSNHFRGRYRSRTGSVFDEQSLALEVLFVSKQELVLLATLLVRELSIASVLARSNATRDVYVVEP